MNPLNANSNPEARSHVAVMKGRGDLEAVEVVTLKSSAEIYYQGATVTHFQRRGDEPLLFLSQCSRFEPEQAIRGGIPICFPWFGMPEGKPVQHGYARLKIWELESVDQRADGSVSVRLRLPDTPEGAEFPLFAAEYAVTVGDSLTLELRVTNQSPDTPFTFQECLHTYFHVGDVSDVSVLGLKDYAYLDKVDGFAQKREAEDGIRFDMEVDRVYLDAPNSLEIRDESLKRRISIETDNAQSVVVWNPWVEKSKTMSDFGDEEFRRMVCVESGNVAANQVTLEPGETSRLTVRLSSTSL